MRKLIFVSAFCLFFLHNYAQKTTGKLSGLKDVWGTSFDYHGEISNNKPNGFGVAIYNKDAGAIRYVGYFVNGVMSGKGTMTFKNGAFLTGDWKNGKMDGKGANVNSEGTFYVGEMKDGVRNGSGWLVLKSDGFYLGEFKNDTYNGMGIYGWSDGRTLGQNIYADGKRNGPGYQFEAKTNQLFEGIWKDDKWQNATTGDFPSFMQATGFKCDTSDKQILFAALDANRYAKDTTFFYNKEKNKRYFGVFKDGYIESGLQWTEGKKRLIGNYNDKGATGYCNVYNMGDYYSEGNYTDDYLDGNNGLFLDLKDSTLYIGAFAAGKYTGKAKFISKKNTIYDGDYLEGQFTGNGRIIYSSGRCLTGTFVKGSPTKLTSITTSNGKSINASPAAFAEALNTVVNEFYNYFDNIVGDNLEKSDYEYADRYVGYLHFPGDKDPVNTTDFDGLDLYQTKLAVGKDEKTAEKLYYDFANQILKTSISGINSNGDKVNLEGDIVKHEAGSSETYSTFSLTENDNSVYDIMHVWLVMAQDPKTNDYTIVIVIGGSEIKDLENAPYFL